MNNYEAGVGSFAAHCEGYGIPGLASRQAAYDAAEPDNTDVCEGCEDSDCETCDGDCCDACRYLVYEEEDY